MAETVRGQIPITNTDDGKVYSVKWLLNGVAQEKLNYTAVKGLETAELQALFLLNGKAYTAAKAVIGCYDAAGNLLGSAIEISNTSGSVIDGGNLYLSKDTLSINCKFYDSKGNELCDTSLPVGKDGDKGDNYQPNLLKGANKKLASSAYLIGQYAWDGSKPADGTLCTLTVCYKVDSADTVIKVFQDSGTQMVATLESKTEVIESYQWTYKAKSGLSAAQLLQFTFFHETAGASSYASGTYVKWAVVTMGANAAATAWVPAASEMVGQKGDKGDKGEAGPKGDKGDTGATGAKGDKGDKGDKGATGEAAESWTLKPLYEELHMERQQQTQDGTTYTAWFVKGKLQYSLLHTVGETTTVVAPSTSAYWRAKSAKSTTWANKQTSGAYWPSSGWLYSRDPSSGGPWGSWSIDESTYADVEVVVGGTTVYAKQVPVGVKPDAWREVNTEQATISEGVQALNTKTSQMSTSIMTLESSQASLATRMGNAEAKISTSVQFDKDGVITSNVKLSADKIDLNGLVTANDEFSIDKWGNVKTGVQYGSATAQYIVEDKSNLVFDQNVNVYLPNDPEYIGRRVLIFALPKCDSEGYIHNVDGTLTSGTITSSTAKVQIETGRVFVNWLYGDGNGIWADNGADDMVTVDASKRRNIRSVLTGTQFFPGHTIVSRSDGSVSHASYPQHINLQCGYVELLGVPYTVNLFRVKDYVEDGKKYSVHMSRADDGTIDDTDLTNGLIAETTTTESNTIAASQAGTPWKYTMYLTRWTVINVQANTYSATA